MEYITPIPIKRFDLTLIVDNKKEWEFCGGFAIGVLIA